MRSEIANMMKTKRIRTPSVENIYKLYFDFWVNVCPDIIGGWNLSGVYSPDCSSPPEGDWESVPYGEPICFQSLFYIKTLHPGVVKGFHIACSVARINVWYTSLRQHNAEVELTSFLKRRKTHFIFFFSSPNYHEHFPVIQNIALKGVLRVRAKAALALQVFHLPQCLQVFWIYSAGFDRCWVGKTCALLPK